LWVGVAVAIACCCASQEFTEESAVWATVIAYVGASVNPGVGTVVAAAAEPTVMVWDAVFVLLPSEFVAIRVTV
jgi:hypothetical protein